MPAAMYVNAEEKRTIKKNKMGKDEISNANRGNHRR
jgi:hypothetical protein